MIAHFSLSQLMDLPFDGTLKDELVRSTIDAAFHVLTAEKNNTMQEGCFSRQDVARKMKRRVGPPHLVAEQITRIRRNELVSMSSDAEDVYSESVGVCGVSPKDAWDNTKTFLVDGYPSESEDTITSVMIAVVVIHTRNKIFKIQRHADSPGKYGTCKVYYFTFRLDSYNLLLILLFSS